MSYATDLASILSNVTKTSHSTVRTVNDGIERYMIDYLRRGCSMRTIMTAYVDLLRFSEDISIHETNGRPLLLQNVSREVIETHLARMAQGTEVRCTKLPSPHTVERRRRIIKAFLRWLIHEGYMDHDPTTRLSKVHLRQRFPSVWTVQDVQRFLNTFDRSDFVGHRDYVMAIVALSSGLRAGELAHLRPIDIDLRSRTLTVSDKGKTGARTAVMSTSAASELARWLKRRDRELLVRDVDPLFPSIGLQRNYGCEPLRASSISYVIYKHAKQAGIEGVKLGAHALRHTAASHLARSGASAFEIQRFLGHASIEMSQRYVAMSNETVQKRVEESGVLAQVEQMNENFITQDSVQDTLRKILGSR